MPLLGSLIKKAYALKNKPVEKRRRTVAPEIAQKKQLAKLIRKAQFTAFGEHYKFSKMLASKNIERAFHTKVPIHDYQSMYKRWWYRALNGETYVAWPGKVKYFALSSGTSDSSSKYIPITGDMLRAIKRASFSQLSGTVNYDFSIDFFEKGILMIGGSTHLQYNGTYFEGDLSGITAGNIPFWFPSPVSAFPKLPIGIPNWTKWYAWLPNGTSVLLWVFRPGYKFLWKESLRSIR